MVQDLLRAWRAVPPWARVLGGLAALLVATGALIASLVGRLTGYSVLYSSLTPDQAGRVIAALEAHHVPFRVTRDGSEIDIPAERVAAVRMQLAQEGLPEGAVGFGIFDHLPLGAGQTVEDVAKLRALEGQLVGAIETLRPIQSAQVMLALPRESVFTEESKPARASVVVRLRPGAALSDDEVAAITHLVAGSVQGLSPANVSVVDDQGHLLAAGSGGGSQDPAGVASRERQLETQVHRKIASLVDAAVGPGHSVVAVQVLLNTKKAHIVSTVYSRGTSAPLSQQKTTETYTGAGPGPGGVPGVKGQVPVYGTPAGSAGPASSYSHTQETTNFQVGTTQTDTQDPGGQISQIHVSVLLDAGSVSAATADDLRKAIQAGFLDPGRGDTLAVERVAFWKAQTATAQATGTAPGGAGRPFPVPVLVAAGLVALAAVGGVLVLLLRRRPAPAPQPAAAPALVSQGPGPARPEEPTGAEGRVTEWVRENPARAADLIKQWIGQPSQVNGSR